MRCVDRGGPAAAAAAAAFLALAVAALASPHDCGDDVFARPSVRRIVSGPARSCSCSTPDVGSGTEEVIFEELVANKACDNSGSSTCSSGCSRSRSDTTDSSGDDADELVVLHEELLETPSSGSSESCDCTEYSITSTESSTSCDCSHTNEVLVIDESHRRHQHYFGCNAIQDVSVCPCDDSPDLDDFRIIVEETSTSCDSSHSHDIILIEGRPSSTSSDDETFEDTSSCSTSSTSFSVSDLSSTSSGDDSLIVHEIHVGVSDSSSTSDDVLSIDDCREMAHSQSSCSSSPDVRGHYDSSSTQEDFIVINGRPRGTHDCSYDYSTSSDDCSSSDDFYSEYTSSDSSSGPDYVVVIQEVGPETRRSSVYRSPSLRDDVVLIERRPIHGDDLYHHGCESGLSYTSDDYSSTFPEIYFETCSSTSDDEDTISSDCSFDDDYVIVGHGDRGSSSTCDDDSTSSSDDSSLCSSSSDSDTSSDTSSNYSCYESDDSESDSSSDNNVVVHRRELSDCSCSESETISTETSSPSSDSDDTSSDSSDCSAVDTSSDSGSSTTCSTSTSEEVIVQEVIFVDSSQPTRTSSEDSCSCSDEDTSVREIEFEFSSSTTDSSQSTRTSSEDSCSCSDEDTSVREIEFEFSSSTTDSSQSTRTSSEDSCSCSDEDTSVREIEFEFSSSTTSSDDSCSSSSGAVPVRGVKRQVRPGNTNCNHHIVRKYEAVADTSSSNPCTSSGDVVHDDAGAHRRGGEYFADYPHRPLPCSSDEYFDYREEPQPRYGDHVVVSGGPGRRHVLRRVLDDGSPECGFGTRQNIVIQLDRPSSSSSTSTSYCD